jgi:ankyrin
MDCQNINESAKMATELYREAICVPYMSKFVVFTKRHDPQEAKLRCFCMTDDKMEKTLESQEHYSKVAESKDVEVSSSVCLKDQSIVKNIFTSVVMSVYG